LKVVKEILHGGGGLFFLSYSKSGVCVYLGVCPTLVLVGMTWSLCHLKA